MVNPLSAADLDALAAAFEWIFPDIGAVRPLRVLGSGVRSVALETPGGVVLRVGRSSDAMEDYAKEWRIGKFLTAELGSIVPDPRWHSPPCEALPFGALGYRKLAGNTPVWGADPGPAFAEDLGAFMAKLHAISAAEARDAGVPEVDAYRRLLGVRDVVEPALMTSLNAQEWSTIRAWWVAFASDARMVSERSTVCHHDLWLDNLLCSDAGRLAGVLDLAHIEIGDPAHDFSAPGYFGAAFMRRLVASYRSSGGRFEPDEAHRARRFHEAREFGGLAWALEHDDADEVAVAIGKIRGGPILHPRNFLW